MGDVIQLKWRSRYVSCPRCHLKFSVSYPCVNGKKPQDGDAECPSCHYYHPRSPFFTKRQMKDCDSFPIMVVGYKKV
jgi:hypothetical protein